MLAKWQAESVRKQLFAATGMEAEIVIIKTSGDKMQQVPLTQIGVKGIFIKELEEALLEEAIDLAVHSVKDVPTDLPSRLIFPAVCRRDDVRDCLRSEEHTSELQSRSDLVCRLLLEKKKKTKRAVACLLDPQVNEP